MMTGGRLRLPGAQRTMPVSSHQLAEVAQSAVALISGTGTFGAYPHASARPRAVCLMVLAALAAGDAAAVLQRDVT